MNHKNAKGMTLIEIVIVIAILGIVVAIAIPSYRQYVLEVNRKATIAELNEVGHLMERQYTINNGAYQAYTLSAAEQPEGYTIAVVLANANQSYTITAAPDAAQSKDRCGTLTLSSDGKREAKKSGTVVNNCFR